MDARLFLNSINNLRKGNREYITNSVLSITDLDEIINQPKTIVIEKEDLKLVLQNEDDFFRLYFYSRNSEFLNQIPNELSLINKTIGTTKDKIIVADIVGKEDSSSVLSNLLQSNGFEKHSKFIRMRCKGPEVRYSKLYDVDFAEETEAKSIHEMIINEFDPLSAHFPTLQEIKEGIIKKEICVVRHENKIVGVTYFEHVSSINVILRYFIVHKEFRGVSIGISLLHHEFQKSNNVVYTLWVGDDNKAKDLYKRIGFCEDGLVDFILKYKG